MKATLFIILLIVLFSCKKETNKVSKIKHVTVKKENNQGKFFMYYSKDKYDEASFDSIIIKNKFNKKIQKIKFKKDYFLPSWQADFSVSEDINFDGFNDLKVINYYGLYNYSYSFWLFKSEKHYYKHVSDLDSIYNPGIDNEKKEINSEWRVAFQSYHFEKYFWKNDRLILKEERIEETTNSGDTMHVHTRKLVNGNYIVKDIDVKQ